MMSWLNLINPTQKYRIHIKENQAVDNNTSLLISMHPSVPVGLYKSLPQSSQWFLCPFYDKGNN